MADNIYTLTELNEMIRPILMKYKAEKAILFGSYARQEANAGSDIDLYVVGGVSFDPTDIFCIADELYSVSGKNVDVYEEKEINPGSAFYTAIQKEGVRVV